MCWVNRHTFCSRSSPERPPLHCRQALTRSMSVNSMSCVNEHNFACELDLTFPTVSERVGRWVAAMPMLALIPDPSLQGALDLRLSHPAALTRHGEITCCHLERSLLITLISIKSCFFNPVLFLVFFFFPRTNDCIFLKIFLPYFKSLKSLMKQSGAFWLLLLMSVLMLRDCKLIF